MKYTGTSRVPPPFLLVSSLSLMEIISLKSININIKNTMTYRLRSHTNLDSSHYWGHVSIDRNYSGDYSGQTQILLKQKYFNTIRQQLLMM